MSSNLRVQVSVDTSSTFGDISKLLNPDSSIASVDMRNVKMNGVVYIDFMDLNEAILVVGDLVSKGRNVDFVREDGSLVCADSYLTELLNCDSKESGSAGKLRPIHTQDVEKGKLFAAYEKLWNRDDRDLVISRSNILADGRKSIMISGLMLEGYSQMNLLNDLTKFGLVQYCDALYLPFDRRNRKNQGFAFASLSSAKAVEIFYDTLNLKNVLKPEGSKVQNVIKVSYAKVQGSGQLIGQFQSSTIAKTPMEHRPLIATDSYIFSENTASGLDFLLQAMTPGSSSPTTIDFFLPQNPGDTTNKSTVDTVTPTTSGHLGMDPFFHNIPPSIDNLIISALSATPSGPN